MLPYTVKLANICKPGKADREETTVLDSSESTFEPHGYLLTFQADLLTRN